MYMLDNYVHVQPTNQPQPFSSHCQGSTHRLIRTPDRTASESRKFAHAQYMNAACNPIRHHMIWSDVRATPSSYICGSTHTHNGSSWSPRSVSPPLRPSCALWTAGASVS